MELMLELLDVRCMAGSVLFCCRSSVVVAIVLELRLEYLGSDVRLRRCR